MLRIADLRREKGRMTQEQLAAATGQSQSNISEIERGKHNPTLETLAKIAKALDVEIYELFSSYPRTDLSRRILDLHDQLDDAGRAMLLRMIEAAARPPQ